MLQRRDRPFRDADHQHHIFVEGGSRINAWLLLILAGLCEIGWPLGLKWAQSGLWRLPGFITAGVCMLVSGALLFMAQKHIPIGTAYAVWTGIGAAGTFLAGALLFGDPIQPLRLAGIALIIAGVALLKLA